MKRVQFDIDDIINLEGKKALLKDIAQEDLISVFKGYRVDYKPKEVKAAALDQRITIGITASEKDALTAELREVKKTGICTVSQYVRSRALGEVDLAQWAEYAIKGIKELNSDRFNAKALAKEKNKLSLLLDKLEDDDIETITMTRREIKQIDANLEELAKPTERKGYRLSGRLTFEEANIVRWKAARLTLTVADYMRFLIFGLTPFSEADRHLSIDSRKRFYISIIEISNSGWGKVPVAESCANCVRLRSDIEALKTKLDRYEKFSNGASTD